MDKLYEDFYTRIDKLYGLYKRLQSFHSQLSKLTKDKMVEYKKKLMIVGAELEVLEKVLNLF